MKLRLATNITTYAALGTAAGISFLLPDALTVPVTNAMAPPETSTLTGILRDFSKTHPDFDVTPVGGLGHYAYNAQTWLPGTNRPIHTPTTGFKVDTQWRDEDSREIAPKLSGVIGILEEAETLGIRVTDKVDVKSDCQIDSFNSTRGLYGVGGNFGAAAYVSTNSTDKDKIKVDKKALLYGDTFCGPAGDPGKVIGGGGLITGSKLPLPEEHEMPQLTLPEDFDPPMLDVTIDAITVTWVGDIDPDDGVDEPALDIDDFRILNGGELRVQGDLRIKCDSFEIKKASKISLAPGANVTIFVTEDEDVKIDENVQINVPGLGDADLHTGIVTLLYLGDKKVKVEDFSHMYGTIIAPDGELEVKDDAHVYGAFVGKKLKLDKRGSFHVDAVNGDTGLANPSLLVRDKIEVKKADIFDGFDSDLGPYDGPDDGATNWHDQALLQTLSTQDNKVKIQRTGVQGNVLVGPDGDPSDVIDYDDGGSITGYAGEMAVPLPIPVVAAPAMAVPNSDKVEYKNGTFSLSTDLHCKEFKMEDAILEISGNVTIRNDGKAEIKKKSEIKLLPGASLTFYTKDTMKIEDKCLVNMNTGDPKLVSIRRMSLGKKGKIEIKKGSEVCAWIQGAKTELKVQDANTKFFGSFIGDKFKAEENTEIHIDTAFLRTCTSIADVDGTAGVASTGGITSEASFGEWFHDKLGVNQSTAHSITMTKNAGVWEYIDNAFKPINDELLGNEGEAENNYFTYSIAADFTYSDCGGQFFEFQGGDGAWLYIDGRLAIDLGGVQSGVPQYIDLDRFGLSGGETYNFRLFYAQRTADSSGFMLRTNVDLDTDPYAPSVLSAFD